MSYFLCRRLPHPDLFALVKFEDQGRDLHTGLYTTHFTVDGKIIRATWHDGRGDFRAAARLANDAKWLRLYGLELDGDLLIESELIESDGDRGSSMLRTIIDGAHFPLRDRIDRMLREAGETTITPAERMLRDDALSDACRAAARHNRMMAAAERAAAIRRAGTIAAQQDAMVDDLARIDAARARAHADFCRTITYQWDVTGREIARDLRVDTTTVPPAPRPGFIANLKRMFRTWRTRPSKS